MTPQLIVAIALAAAAAALVAVVLALIAISSRHDRATTNVRNVLVIPLLAALLTGGVVFGAHAYDRETQRDAAIQAWEGQYSNFAYQQWLTQLEPADLDSLIRGGTVYTYSHGLHGGGTYSAYITGKNTAQGFVLTEKPDGTIPAFTLVPKTIPTALTN